MYILGRLIELFKYIGFGFVNKSTGQVYLVAYKSGFLDQMENKMKSKSLKKSLDRKLNLHNFNKDETSINKSMYNSNNISSRKTKQNSFF